MTTNDFAIGVSSNALGQPWCWRRAGGDDLGVNLVDQLLLARGIEQADLARHRDPRIRDFLPDPSVFADMDKAAARLRSGEFPFRIPPHRTFSARPARAAA